MEPIHVFCRIDCQQNFLGIDVSRQWKLYQNAINLIAPVQVCDHLKQFLRRNRLRRGMLLAVNSNLAATLHLSPDVDLGRRIMADKNHSQPWTYAGCRHRLYFRRDFRPNFASDLVTIQNNRSHQSSFLLKANRIVNHRSPCGDGRLARLRVSPAPLEDVPLHKTQPDLTLYHWKLRRPPLSHMRFRKLPNSLQRSLQLSLKSFFLRIIRVRRNWNLATYPHQRP